MQSLTHVFDVCVALLCVAPSSQLSGATRILCFPLEPTAQCVPHHSFEFQAEVVEVWMERERGGGG